MYITIKSKKQAKEAIAYLKKEGFKISRMRENIILVNWGKIHCIYGDKFSNTISFLVKTQEEKE